MLVATNTNDSFNQQVAVLERDAPTRRPGRSSGDFWHTGEPTIVVDPADKSNTRMKLIRGGMWPSHKKWWTLPNQIKILCAGYGGGKSFTLVKRAIAVSLQNAPVPTAIVSPTFAMARRTTIPTMLALLEARRKYLGPSFWYRYNKSVHEFTIKYHGRTAHIFILSGEDPESLKGSNLGAAYMDEAFSMDIAVFQQILTRVRHPDAGHLEVGLLGTPESIIWGHDLVKLAIRRQKGLIGRTEIPEDMDADMAALDIGVVTASMLENKLLPKSYIEQMKATWTAKAARAYIDGEFVNLTEGRVFYEFDEDIHVLPKHRAPAANSEIGVGMDFNVQPMSALAFEQIDDTMYYFDEIMLDNSDTQQMAAELRAKSYGARIRTIYPDPAGRHKSTNSPEGKTDFHYLEERGFSVEAPYSSYNFKDTLNICNGRFKNVNGQVKVVISPRCKELIKSLNALSHKKLNLQEDLKHVTDAFRYPQASLFPLPTDLAGTIHVHGA